MNWDDAWHSWSIATEVAMGPRASAGQLQRWRERRWRELLRSAVAGSRHYRRVMAGRDPTQTPLQALPVAHKAELMQRFSDWVTDPRIDLADLRHFLADPKRIGEDWQGRYTVWESSGSTGEPAVFVQDAQSMAVHDAITWLRRPQRRPLQAWVDPWGLGERLAFVGATSGHFASTVSVERWRRRMPALAHRLRCFSFTDALPTVCAALHDFAPTQLATYPSEAVLLAQAQQAGRLHLNLQEVLTGGECLSDAQRHFVQEAFGCPVSHSYGASEFFSLAFECPNGRMHLNIDWAILEPVDADGQPVPVGELGHTTLLTNLANHVQPLIRYDLGDQVRFMPEACTCGSSLPVIEVEGRQDDVLMVPGRSGMEVVRLMPLALCTVLEEAGLFDFQLRQTGATDFQLLLGHRHTPNDGLIAQAIERLHQLLACQDAAPVHVRVNKRARPSSGRSGKTPRVVALGQA